MVSLENITLVWTHARTRVSCTVVTFLSVRVDHKAQVFAYGAAQRAEMAAEPQLQTHLDRKT